MFLKHIGHTVINMHCIFVPLNLVVVVCLFVCLFFGKSTVYFSSQVLEHSSIGENWNISGVPVLPENVIFTFLRTR